jgi:hypothetical protein
MIKKMITLFLCLGISLVIADPKKDTKAEKPANPSKKEEAKAENKAEKPNPSNTKKN